MVNFNKLKDTNFPNVDTVDAYQYQVNFNFEEFRTAQMRIRLLSVPWDLGSVHVGQREITGIGNVVKFENDATRDAYFNDKRYATNSEEWKTGNYDGIEWVTQYRHYHSEDVIKIPVPWNVASTYNYIEVTFMSNDIDFEQVDIPRRHYFIRNMKSLALNTTECVLMADFWTTYINLVAPNITGMILERGHAAMTLTDVDRYLANPINNASGLLTEDVNFTDTYVSTIHSAITLNSGDMWAVIVTNSATDYDWGSWENPDSGRLRTGQLRCYLQDGAPELFSFAVNPADLYSFLYNIDDSHPQFKQTVKGVYFISKNLVEVIGSSFVFGNVTCYKLAQKTVVSNVANLTRQSFDFGEEYENLAKLYTYPYSYLEISDENGNIEQIRIETTSGQINLTITSNLVFPWLSLDGRLVDVGEGTSRLTFSNVNEKTFEFSGEWFHHIRRWEIPVFAVTQGAGFIDKVKNFHAREQQELENQTAKNNADASNQTAYNNATASNQTTYDNSLANNLTQSTNGLNTNALMFDNDTASAGMNYSNAIDTNQTSYVNATDGNNTIKVNADIQADTVATNQGNSISRTYSNVSDDASLKTLLKGQSNTLIDNETVEGNTKLSWDLISDNMMNWSITGATNESLGISTAINELGGALGSMAQGAIVGAAAGSVVPGAGTVAGGVSGALGSAVSHIIGGAGAAMTTGVSITTNDAVRLAVVQANREKYNHAHDYNVNVATYRKVYNDNQNALTNQYASTVGIRNRDTDNNANQASLSASKTMSTNTKNTSDAIAARSKNTSDANAARTLNTANANIARSKNTSDTNVTNTKNTADANATRTKNTADANATRALNTANANATRNKTTADAGVTAQWNAGRLGNNATFGEFANGETATVRPMALFCNVVTQQKDAIAKAGDHFLKYGYAYDRYWKFQYFNVMPKFSYWKCSDVFMKDLSIPDAHLDYIRFLLMGGVTVWSNPNDIGRVTIYENV